MRAPTANVCPMNIWAVALCFLAVAGGSAAAGLANHQRDAPVELDPGEYEKPVDGDDEVERPPLLCDNGLGPNPNLVFDWKLFHESAAAAASAGDSTRAAAMQQRIVQKTVASFSKYNWFTGDLWGSGGPWRHVEIDQRVPPCAGVPVRPSNPVPGIDCTMLGEAPAAVPMNSSDSCCKKLKRVIQRTIHKFSGYDFETGQKFAERSGKRLPPCAPPSPVETRVPGALRKKPTLKLQKPVPISLTGLLRKKIAESAAAQLPMPSTASGDPDKVKMQGPTAIDTHRAQAATGGA